jgi:hypothetical protein
MRMIGILLIAGLFAVVFPSAPVMIPMTDKATYDFLDYLNVSGRIEIPFTGAKPYRSDEIYKMLLDIKDPDGRTKNFIERFVENYLDKDNRFGKAESENTVGWFEGFWKQSYISQKADKKPAFLKKPYSEKYYRFDDVSQHVTDGGIEAQLTYKDFLSLRTNSGVMIKHKHFEKNVEMRDEYETLVLVPSGGEADFSSEDYTETYLMLSGDEIHFSIGKYPLSLGSGMINSLTLSQMDAYYENFIMSVKADRFKFTTVTGFLLADSQTRFETENPDYAITNDTDVARKNYFKREKYLSAHRLEWRALDNLSLGVNEMVISGDRTIEMGYLIPVLPLFWMGHYYGDHDNSLISFDFSYDPYRNFSFFGELLFDDETFTESWTKNYMNKWAIAGGFSNANFLTVDGLVFNFEYARVEPYVYGHKYHINRYMNLDHFLSVPGGPDSETLNYRLKYFYDFDKHITLGYTRENRGEARWGEWDQPLNYKLENKVFLRGTVEKSNNFYAELHYKFNKYISADFFYSFTKIENYNHNLPRFDAKWLDEYRANNDPAHPDYDDDVTNNYENYQDYYEREVEPLKEYQEYENNTFALKLNFVFKNYFKNLF